MNKQDLIQLIVNAPLSDELKEKLKKEVEEKGATNEVREMVVKYMDLQADIYDEEAKLAGEEAKTLKDLDDKMKKVDEETKKELKPDLDRVEQDLDAIEKEFEETTASEE